MPRRSETGNAVVFIFIAIALFGALSFSFMKSMEGGTSSLSAQESRLLAQTIINESMKIEKALDVLTRRGCSQDQISMEKTPQKTGYDWENTNAPPDRHCHIYEPEGGGLENTPLPTGLGTEAYWGYSAHAGMGRKTSEIGTGFYGIAAYLNGLSDQVCSAINKQLNTGWGAIPSYSPGINCCNMSYNPSTGEGIRHSSHYINCDLFTNPEVPAEHFCPPQKSACYTLNGQNAFYRYVYEVPEGVVND